MPVVAARHHLKDQPPEGHRAFASPFFDFPATLREAENLFIFGQIVFGSDASIRARNMLRLRDAIAEVMVILWDRLRDWDLIPGANAAYANCLAHELRLRLDQLLMVAEWYEIDIQIDDELRVQPLTFGQRVAAIRLLSAQATEDQYCIGFDRGYMQPPDQQLGLFGAFTRVSLSFAKGAAA